MGQKATLPMIIVAVVAVVGLLVFMGKRFLAGGPTNSGKTVYPSFIDPATGKPKAGAGATSGESGPPPSRFQMPNGGSGR